jgi:thiol-disulfide isomerase/thioredoxin
MKVINMRTIPVEFQIGRNIAFGFLAFVVLLITANILLLKQNNEVKGRVQSLLQSRELAPGSYLVPLQGKDITGSSLQVEFKEGKGTLLLIFSPFCGVCEENQPAWERLKNAYIHENMRFVAASLSGAGVNEYLKKHDFTNITVFREIDAVSAVSYRIRTTPQTVLINSQGKVEKVWTGLLSEADVLEIQQSIASLSVKN